MFRQLRRWWRFHTRGACTGQPSCRNHWWVAEEHMGVTFDSWRDYPLPGDR